MKKFFLVLLTILLMVSISTPALAAQVYPDVKVGHWAEKDIAKMKAKGIVAGFADGYHPLEPVSREQAIVMIIRTMGKGEEAYGKKLPSNFKQAEQVSSWARESVALAVQLGLLSQDDINNFRPKEATKRYEMAVFVAKALGYQDSGQVSDLGFADEKDIPAWTKGYIEAVRKEGVMGGLPDNTFCPNDPLNRAQMASLLAALDSKLDKFSHRTTYGKVFSVSTSANSILVQLENGLIQTISVADDAFVYKGKNTSLAAISKDDNVLIITNEQGIALYIEQVDAIQVPAKTEVRGTITLITRTPSVTLRVYEEDGSSNNYVLSNTATVLIDGIASQADELTVGQSVILTVKGNQVTRVEVWTQALPKEAEPEDEDDYEREEQANIQSYLAGQIIDLNSSERLINLQIPGEKGIVRLVLDVRTIIIKRNMPLTFSDLKEDDWVVAVGEYDKGVLTATSLIVLDELD
ncbi:MAG: S-layer homology domain-containing protein [Zhaonellaceae bacterium]|jgi:predicted ribosome-associated RNA-binding protein Tma20